MIFETWIMHCDFDIEDLNTTLLDCHGLVDNVILDHRCRDHKLAYGAPSAPFWTRRVVLGP